MAIPMPVPKAKPGEEFAYYFQYAVFLKEEGNSQIFLDTYQYDALYPPIYTNLDTYVSVPDLERIYAPYLTHREEENELIFYYENLKTGVRTVRMEEWVYKKQNGVYYVPVIGLMANGFGKPAMNQSDLTVIAVDATEKPEAKYSAMVERKRLKDRLHDKKYGEMNYTLWLEEGNRLIPYRMYIPLCYREGTPNKVLVCFHGGDANPDYMFYHTHNEIQNYAERHGYILLALCSYRKYTFFGASKIPAGLPEDDPENPAGLTEEEKIWSDIAERSVKLQMEAAEKRYCIDANRRYALGNSGGSMGIFRQVDVLPTNTFRTVICSGGCPWEKNVNVEGLKTKGTRFLLLLGSEDEYAGPRPYLESYPYLKKEGLDIDLQLIGGGTHLLGWTHALPEIFSYLEEHS